MKYRPGKKEKYSRVYKLRNVAFDVTLGTWNWTLCEAEARRQSLKRIFKTDFEILPYWLVRNEFNQFIRFEQN